MGLLKPQTSPNSIIDLETCIILTHDLNYTLYNP